MSGRKFGAATVLALYLRFRCKLPDFADLRYLDVGSIDSQGIMGKAKAVDKGNEKGGPAAKGKGVKSKSDGSEDKGGKVKGAQQINVRHILVRVPLFSPQDGR